MNNNGRRVAAFLLALLFLLTTFGAAAYVIWEWSRDEGGLVTEDIITQSAAEQSADQNNQEAEVKTIDNFDGPVNVPELRFDDITVGDGEVVQAGDTITIHYTGALASNGQVFDSSVDRGEPSTFELDGLIEGWREGIPGMKVGGKRRLFIPAAMGYGEAGSGANIPPNSDLIFDIELFETK